MLLAANAMTNDELQQVVEANTAAIAQLTATVGQINQALNALVSEFIRPSARQARDNYDRLEQVEGYMVSIAEQQQANAQQIAQNAEAATRFDGRLEETRQLVAKNASNIAQLTVKQDRNDEAISRLETIQENNANAISRLEATQEGSVSAISRLEATQEANAQQIAQNAQQVIALAEASRTQLAAIIGNGRRIDRLEQQAS